MIIAAHQPTCKQKDFVLGAAGVERQGRVQRSEGESI